MFLFQEISTYNNLLLISFLCKWCNLCFVLQLYPQVEWSSFWLLSWLECSMVFSCFWENTFFSTGQLKTVSTRSLEKFQRVASAGEFRLRGFPPATATAAKITNKNNASQPEIDVDEMPPSRITDLHVTSFDLDNFTASLVWTAVGDDMERGTGTQLDRHENLLILFLIIFKIVFANFNWWEPFSVTIIVTRHHFLYLMSMRVVEKKMSHFGS